LGRFITAQITADSYWELRMSGPPATFRDLIQANKRNSAILVAIFCLFVTAVAMILGLAILAYTSPSSFRHLNVMQAVLIGLAAGGISLLISFICYYAGADIIATVSGAKQLEYQADPELFNVVEEMAIAAGLPMPAIYLINDPAPNAFATGRDPQHALVAITTGLRQKLTRDELQGVMAHEMAHIRNYDIRLMMLLAVLVGMVAMMTDVFWQIIFRTGGGRRDRNEKQDKGSGAIMIVLMVVAVILAIIAPILAQIIQLAVSRQREYLADASAVELTRNPQGLASALQKLDADPDIMKNANRGTAHLYIVNPIKKYEMMAASAFASHPPIQDRINRLLKLVRE
jgi:heat shock protein HtpX